MFRTKLDVPKNPRAHGAGPVLAAILLAALGPGAIAQQPGQKTFPSAEAAGRALFAAAQSNDEKAMLDILGPDGRQIISSGDAAEDARNRARFVRKYQEMHRLVQEPDGTTTLYVGAENWPTPIPLAGKGTVWYFRTEAGRKEILYRRIGRNETSAIRVCQELAAAQEEYRSRHGGYAAALSSAPGEHDGLYWKAAEGEPGSPIGPLLAAAGGQDGVATPFRGYFYRILTRQGAKAPGGAMDYFVDGSMTRGFAFVAFPAVYRSSGVMTFIVNQGGVVFERDLGPKTGDVARTMEAYNPTPGWRKAD